MKKQTKIIALLFAGSLLTAGGIQASDHHKGKQCDGKMMHMMKKLDLTDAQHDAIKAIKENQHGKKEQHRSEMKLIREQMRKQVASNQLDLSEVRKLAHQKALLVENMTVSKAQTMHRIHQQLTPEQSAKLEKMKDKLHKRMQEKHQH